VFGDGGCAGVVALFVQGFAQPHNLFFQLGTNRAGIVVGAARVCFERRRTLGFVAFD
jgi:hypothetical protein